MHFLTTAYLKSSKTPIAIHRLNSFLMQKTDAYKVKSIIEVMEKAGMIKMAMTDGKQGYVPKTKGMTL